MNILPGAARAFLVHHRTMIIKLQRNADHLVALLMQQRRHRRRIHPARHGDDDPGVGGGFGDTERELSILGRPSGIFSSFINTGFSSSVVAEMVYINNINYFPHISVHAGTEKPIVYLPALPNTGVENKEDVTLLKAASAARFDLIDQLSEKGFEVHNILGPRPWLKNMLKHAAGIRTHSYFRPQSVWMKNHKRHQSEAAQRWFEFFSLITGDACRAARKASRNGIAKPCIVMGPD